MDRIHLARLMPGRRGLEHAEPLHLVDHREAAQFVHRELREALVVRGGERVDEARRVTARRRVEQVLRQIVRRADEATRPQRCGARLTQHRGSRHHLHQRRRRVGARRGKLARLGRRVAEDAAVGGVHHDHVSEFDVAQDADDALGQRGVERVLDLDGTEHALRAGRHLAALDDPIARRFRQRRGPGGGTIRSQASGGRQRGEQFGGKLRRRRRRGLDLLPGALGPTRLRLVARELDEPCPRRPTPPPATARSPATGSLARLRGDAGAAHQPDTRGEAGAEHRRCDRAPAAPFSPPPPREQRHISTSSHGNPPVLPASVVLGQTVASD